MELVSRIDGTNSIRKEQICQRFQLFADNEMNHFIENFDEQANVALVGESEFDNKKDISEFFQILYKLKIKRLVLDRIIIDGENTSVVGEADFGDVMFDFCLVSRCQMNSDESLITELKIFSAEQKI